ncbi:ABC transporter ATP-binding protein [Kroppenstedtia pulmonis]|uniref:ABC transporter ATP-binding protein n=1 Tax=Kroppenstedtia pulmonis TaxID=1380685 RepID=A0A7D3Y8K4_9BACL|nr:ABC transporter ATP-binding protein [Kroppenstedtia pulmonis]QKG83681.1 ABC transporter ATP-binding protein [Kroppenstedtia pulmonis]
MKVQLKDIRQSYPTSDGRRSVLQDIQLSVREGEFVSLIGPSGCGKSTLFNILSGLETPDHGSVIKDDRVITGETGHVGYMMQQDCLFPWRTVLGNAVVAAEAAGKGRKEALERAKELLPIFGLEDFADEYPTRLSGGMRQRVALLRTVVSERDVWLLDEPMGALDAITREQMQDWLLAIWSRFRQTILFITHSIDEALYLSDRVILLTSRPASIQGEMTVDLPRPRSRSLVTQPQFLRLKEEIWSQLHHV